MKFHQWKSWPSSSKDHGRISFLVYIDPFFGMAENSSGRSTGRRPMTQLPDSFDRVLRVVLFGKFDTPVCQLFWHVSPLRPLQRRANEGRGTDTRAFRPPIRPPLVSRNDMRVVQSDIEQWNARKKKRERREEKRKHVPVRETRKTYIYGRRSTIESRWSLKKSNGSGRERGRFNFLIRRRVTVRRRI